MTKRNYSIQPPRGFRAADNIEWVKHSQVTPSFVTQKRLKGSRGQGLRYEKQLHKHLSELSGCFYVPGPWFQFSTYDHGVRWCQPDGLLFFPYTGQITIVECKLQHTSDAWWQLKWLYQPVLRQLFPPSLWKFALLEIVKWYDPQTPFPESHRRVPSIFSAHPGEFSVHIWRG